jgi:hypothetical protein
MKRFLIFLFLGFSSMIVYGQVDTVTIHTFGGIQDDGCKQVEATPDRGYIMIGTTNSFGVGYTSFYAIKTDSLCNFKWSKTYGGANSQEGYSVAPTLDKGYVFVGFTNSYGAGGYDVYLVKTDSMGNEKWQQTYGGSNWDFGYSVKQLKDSGFIISGVTYSYGPGNGNMYIVRTDKLGNVMWQVTAGDTGYSAGNAIYVLNDSIYLIAGSSTSYGGHGDTNACIVRIQDYGDSGHILSTGVYGKNQNSVFYSISQTPDKGFIMNSSNDSISKIDSGSSFPWECTYKVDSNGQYVWMQLFNGGNLPAIGKDAIELKNDSIYSLSSNSDVGAGGYDFYFHVSNSGGNWLAGTTFGGTKDELAGSIAIGKNGDIVLAGCSDTYPTYSCGLFDVFMVKLKPSFSFGLYDTVVTRFIDTTEWPASVHQIQEHIGVNIFPDPVVTSATILVQGNDMGRYTFNLYNITGECVIKNYPLKNIGNGQAVAVLQKGNLASGVYNYEIISNGITKAATGKIIIE